MDAKVVRLPSHRFLNIISKSEQIWKDKVGMELQIHPMIQFHPDLVELLGKEQIQKLLRFRRILDDKDVESEDIQVLRQILLESKPPRYYPRDQPEWRSCFKASHYVSLKDSKRMRISMDELCGIKW